MTTTKEVRIRIRELGLGLEELVLKLGKLSGNENDPNRREFA